MKRFALCASTLLSFAIAASGETVTKEVSYESGGVTMKGIIAWDDSSTEKRPGVVVVHEWWGHNYYARKRAAMLAELGYVAIAVDMYGDGKTADHPKDAGTFAKEVMKNLEVAKARFEAAVNLLNQQPLTDSAKTAAIGYCFGGGVVLNMARLGSELDGVVSFHGSLGSSAKAKPGKVKAKVLVCNGAADKFVSADSIAAFKDEMQAANVDFAFKSYPDALHGFTNPGATENGRKFGIPIAYQQAADEASWTEMQDFFSKIFAQ